MFARISFKLARAGFTLIELLIVVAIIAILAAIAVPNFLEAQTRAKVSRVRSDLRTVATALEAYFVDNNHYPPNDGIPGGNTLPKQLTTPVSFLTSIDYFDPFTTNLVENNLHGAYGQRYSYQKIVGLNLATPLVSEAFIDSLNGFPPPSTAVDSIGQNPGAFIKYGRWKTLSYGPDQKYDDNANFGSDAPLYGQDVLYDPTNGTVSFGNIIRTQLSAQGENIK